MSGDVPLLVFIVLAFKESIDDPENIETFDTLQNWPSSNLCQTWSYPANGYHSECNLCGRRSSQYLSIIHTTVIDKDIILMIMNDELLAENPYLKEVGSSIKTLNLNSYRRIDVNDRWIIIDHIASIHIMINGGLQDYWIRLKIGTLNPILLSWYWRTKGMEWIMKI